MDSEQLFELYHSPDQCFKSDEARTSYEPLNEGWAKCASTSDLQVQACLNWPCIEACDSISREVAWSSSTYSVWC
jgi:hypothetical protein